MKGNESPWFWTYEGNFREEKQFKKLRKVLESKKIIKVFQDEIILQVKNSGMKLFSLFCDTRKKNYSKF